MDNWELDYKLEDSHVYYRSKNGKYMACIVMPHSGTDYKYMLRIAKVEGFDRWSFADVEEYFDTFEDSKEYMDTYLS